MSPEDFESYYHNIKTEDEEYACMDEVDFRDWCKLKENNFDPRDTSARELYKEICEESGSKAWDNMSNEDRIGWIDNMNKY